MSDPLIVASGISRRYENGPFANSALQQTSCVVRANDRIALVGPSGSGKSTLLHLLGGLDTPTTGTLTWPTLGQRSQLRPAKVMDIFQGPSLLVPLTVIENVRLPMLLGNYADREATERAEAALKRFDVQELRDKLPEEISGGQAQRVAIARAVAVEPALILADEPTGQLDSQTAQQVLDQLFACLDQIGAAMIMATHDLNVARQLNAIWNLRDGRLVTQVRDAACSL